MGTSIGLNLGCGHKHYKSTPELQWINVDTIPDADVSTDLRKLPFDDDYADYIEAIHVVEHFFVDEMDPLLKEWKRVLKKDAQIIFELPCMEKILVNFVQKKDMRYTWLGLYGDATSDQPLMAHHWCYSKGQFRALLEQVGFRDIEIQEPKYHSPERDMRFIARK